MQGSEEANSGQIPRQSKQAHPSTTLESQPSASPDSGQPNEGERRTFGHQTHWSYFRIPYRRWHMRRRLRSAKQSRTKGLITHYSRGRKASVRPIATCPDPPASTVYSSSGSNSVDYEFNFANSETHPSLEEDLTPTAGGRQADTRQRPDVACPSRRSGSLGKRKQRDATDAMAYEAMEEVRDYFRGISQTGGGSEQSVQNGGLVQCMNIMKGMGYSSHHQMMMWHYFDSHQHLMGPFCQVDDDLRREIIGSVINP